MTGSLFPTAGAHAIEDGVSIVSANWLAEHLGVNPEYAAGFQGFGQIPGSVAMAVNAIASPARLTTWCCTGRCTTRRAATTATR